MLSLQRYRRSPCDTRRNEICILRNPCNRSLPTFLLMLSFSDISAGTRSVRPLIKLFNGRAAAHVMLFPQLNDYFFGRGNIRLLSFLEQTIQHRIGNVNGRIRSLTNAAPITIMNKSIIQSSCAKQKHDGWEIPRHADAIRLLSASDKRKMLQLKLCSLSSPLKGRMKLFLQVIPCRADVDYFEG